MSTADKDRPIAESLSELAVIRADNLEALRPARDTEINII